MMADPIPMPRPARLSEHSRAALVAVFGRDALAAIDQAPAWVYAGAASRVETEPARLVFAPAHEDYLPVLVHECAHLLHALAYPKATEYCLTLDAEVAAVCAEMILAREVPALAAEVEMRLQVFRRQPFTRACVERAAWYLHVSPSIAYSLVMFDVFVLGGQMIRV